LFTEGMFSSTVNEVSELLEEIKKTES